MIVDGMRAHEMELMVGLVQILVELASMDI